MVYTWAKPFRAVVLRNFLSSSLGKFQQVALDAAEYPSREHGRVCRTKESAAEKVPQEVHQRAC